MATTTNQVISDAYFASGVVSPELETVSGAQISDGLRWLNEILLEKTIDESMIPYEGTHNEPMVIGQEEYSIAGLVSVDTATFVLDDVRYELHEDKRQRYLGSYRVNNINSLPYSFYVQREFGGSKIFLYFKPDQAYVMTIYGRFSLSQVTLGQVLDSSSGGGASLDMFYVSYLKWCLAERICSEYSAPIPAELTRQLDKYNAWIAKRSNVYDFRMKKQSTLQNGVGLNWAFINLSKGYLP